jgi:hypothetical protein
VQHSALIKTTHFAAPNYHLTPHPFNKNANNKIDNTHTKSKRKKKQKKKIPVNPDPHHDGVGLWPEWVRPTPSWVWPETHAVDLLLDPRHSSFRVINNWHCFMRAWERFMVLVHRIKRGKLEVFSVDFVLLDFPFVPFENTRRTFSMAVCLTPNTSKKGSICLL